MKMHFLSALPWQYFCQGWQDFILRASTFTLATSAKILIRSKLIRLLPLLHISPRIGSIMCTIQFKLLKVYQYIFKVRHHPLFVPAYTIIITIHFMCITNNRFTWQSLLLSFGCNQGCGSSNGKVASIQFIKEVLCRLNCFIES